MESTWIKVLLCVRSCASGHSAGQRNKLPAILELDFWLGKWEREGGEQHRRFSEVIRTRSENGEGGADHRGLCRSQDRAGVLFQGHEKPLEDFKNFFPPLFYKNKLF